MSTNSASQDNHLIQELTHLAVLAHGEALDNLLVRTTPKHETSTTTSGHQIHPDDPDWATLYDLLSDQTDENIIQILSSVSLKNIIYIFYFRVLIS